MTIPPPRASPTPNIGPDDAIHTETPSGVYRVVQRTAWHTKVQWGVVGAFLVAVGSFVNYSVGKLDIVNSAMAQTQAQGGATSQKTVELAQRIEAIDAGTRAAIERLERKIDSNNETQEKKLQKMSDDIGLILREVRKR